MERTWKSRHALICTGLSAPGGHTGRRHTSELMTALAASTLCSRLDPQQAPEQRRQQAASQVRQAVQARAWTSAPAPA